MNIWLKIAFTSVIAVVVLKAMSGLVPFERHAALGLVIFLVSCLGIISLLMAIWK